MINTWSLFLTTSLRLMQRMISLTTIIINTFLSLLQLKRWSRCFFFLFEKIASTFLINWVSRVLHCCDHILLKFPLLYLCHIQLLPLCSCSTLVGHKASGLCSVLPRCSDRLSNSGFTTPLPCFLLGIHRCCVFPPETGQWTFFFFLFILSLNWTCHFRDSEDELINLRF